jgi:CRP-like cAMP-binding protein
VLLEPHRLISYAYFLTSSVVSLLCTTEDGATAETAIVGSDGIVGTAIFLGGEATCSRSIVVVPGEAFQMPAKVLMEEFERDLAVQNVLLRYTQALITQISQTAVCHRLHSVQQRLCRWLLLCHDRTGSPELVMTQELLAHLLGGRRESVTVAAGQLQDMGLIHYCRGHIRILDGKGLEQCACECYRTIKEELARLYSAKQMYSPRQPQAALKRAV